jgi:hypothetical protein
MKKGNYPSRPLRVSPGKTSQVLPGHEARLKPVRSEPGERLINKAFFMFLFFLLLVSNIPRLNANTMGSEISWTCIGQDSFLITLVVYRDCNSNALGTGVMYFKCATSGAAITSLNTNPGTGIDITPVCNTSCTKCQSTGCSFPYGIDKYTMQGIVRLNAAGTCCNINLSWQQCCRNNSISTGAAGVNFYTTAMLNRCQNPFNNSPTFSNAPVGILCVGQDFTFRSGIQDIDVNSTGGIADSFTYEWAQPLSSAGGYISYTGQYTYDKPIYFWGFPNDALPFPKGIHLDPETGDIQFRPMKAEATVMVVQVNEFRNGIKIGEIRREMEYIVMNCTSNNPPSLSTVSKNIFCPGKPITFTFSTNDPNAYDTVTISCSNSIPGATWTSTNGQSKHPTGTFTWTPVDSNVSSLPYTFIVTAKDNVCPVYATYSQSYQITVKPKPEANITVADSGCGIFWFSAQRIAGSGPSFQWQGASFAFRPDVGSVISYKFPQPGQYPYTMTMSAGGCLNTYYDTVTIISDSFVSVLLPGDTTICTGSYIDIPSRVFHGKGPLNYLWSYYDTNRNLHFGPITKDETIILYVWDSNGCFATDTIVVYAYKNPAITPITPIEICYTGSYNVKISPVYQVFGSNNGITSFNWHKAGNANTLSVISDLNTTDTGLFVFTISDKNGCVSSDSFSILNSIKKPQITLNDKDYICYNDIKNTTINSVCKVFGNNYIRSYKWQLSGNSGILSDTSFLITKDTGMYHLSIADKFGCEATDSIKVELTKHIDTSLMVNLAVLTAGSGMKSYDWYRNDTFLLSGTLMYMATVNGAYYVILTDTNSCVDTSRTINIKLVNIGNDPFQGYLKIYPNPNSGKLMLEINNPVSGDISLSLINIYGQEILCKTFKPNDLQTTKEINISDQPAGTYTVIIRYQNRNFHQLIIKE